MPTYEYKCRDCGKNFEKIQRISESSLTKCPYCGGKVERVISGGAGLLFKGSGFYATDYRSESYKKDAKKDKPEIKTASSSASDSKPSTDNKKT